MQTKTKGGLVFGSAALVAMIALFEGGMKKDGSSVVYADKLAGGLPTVCGGLTRHVTTTPIIVGERWSGEKCRAEMSKALATVQAQLIKCFRTEPPQSVFDAATSMAWNVGVPSVCGSVSMQYWKAGAWELGCERMSVTASGKPNWSYVGGTFVRGLANRRVKETKHCKGDL